ncbi:MAG TPA: hypothetical protein VFA18_25035, partial [Gemmataceae bacterium]|nr:hypothetical protein [Gemmataceae bacterium]
IGTAKAQRLTGIEKLRIYRHAEFARELSQPYGPRIVTGGLIGPVVVGRVAGVNVVGVVQETRSFTVACNEVPHPPDKPLVLYKWASATSAHVGDVVTIYLKYSNVGGQPINDVAVADSLTGRLEYIPGTAKTNRDAVFTMQVNEAGSMVLHWEVRGTLLPGDSGVVSFQVRVR